MSDGSGASDALDRASWLVSLRRANELQEDELDPTFDEEWGEIDDTHRAFVERFVSRLPAHGRVLDAACGTGRFFGIVLERGRRVLGVDQSGAHLATAQGKHPEAVVERRDLQDLPYRNEFDGVMCVDAMEFVPPEDWPVVLGRFHEALRGGGALYLTVELVEEEDVLDLNRQARTWGLPVVDGEVIWEGPDGYYHYYPALGQVRGWLAEAGFVIDEEREGPWEQGYAYHHVLAHAAEPSS
jgi:SAM-dependent methyltransferase